MFCEVTIVAKVESAPGGEIQHMFHLTPRFGWGAVLDTSGDGPTFAIKVLPSVFADHNVGDVIRLERVSE